MDCATVRVLVDWERPDGPSIDLAVARRQASGPHATGETLLFLPGGPGGSGVNAVRDNPQLLTPEISRRFDVVSFDPRGVGRSHPVLCDAGVLAEPYPQIPRSQTEFDALKEHNRRLGESCREHTGVLFDHLDTLSVVRDLDAIRAALGVRQTSLYGTSYGTLLGQQYAERYPHRVRALVLDSVMDHSVRTAEQFVRTQSVSFEAGFDRFAGWCAATADCALRGEDAGAVVRHLLARAERGDLVDPGMGPLSPLLFLGVLATYFYQPSWPQAAAWLDTLRRPGAPTRGSAAIPRIAASPVTAEAEAAVFCQDWSLPVRDFAALERLRLRTLRLAPDTTMSPLAWHVTTMCLGWPAAVRNPQRTPHVRTVPPALVVNSRHDPATPYSWAVTATRHNRAVLLRYDGSGHSLIWKDIPCVTAHVERYLVSLRPPARGAACADATS